MIFVGINDQFGRAAEALQSLVHLFAAQDRDVPVDFATHEESRSRYVGYPVEGGDFFPKCLVLPRQAELSLIVLLILVVAVHAGEQSRSSARGGGFEPRGLGDDEISGDASIRPAADAELIRVSDALRDGVIRDGHVVLKILVAPIGEDGLAEFLAVAGGAARIGEEDNVAVCGEKLDLMVKLGVIRPNGTAVGKEESRILLARCVIERFVEITGDGGTVLALEVDVLGWR